MNTPSNEKYLRLLWLCRLRWGAIAGQIAIFICAYFFLKLKISVYPFIAIIAVYILSNSLLSSKLRNKDSSSSSAAASAIFCDIFLLSLTLYFYGGHTNPFSMMYLILVVLAAIFLSKGWSFIALVISTVCFYFLSFYYVSVPELALHHMHSDASDTFSLHLQGMLLAFVLLGALICYFIEQLNIDLKKNEADLKELQALAAQESKLAALTTLAAGAAHELATPLGTIAVIAHELSLQADSLTSQQAKSDIQTIKNEIDRCESILRSMGANSGELAGELPRLTDAVAVINELKSRLSSDHASRLKISSPLPQCSFVVTPSALISSLFSLIKNAFDASLPNAEVSLEIKLQTDTINFIVSDSGSGISQSIIERIGEPFFTTKEPGCGLGLGVFLVKLFAKRSGGILKYSMAASGGTIALLSMPRGNIYGKC